jgi:hypothetical protein
MKRLSLVLAAMWTGYRRLAVSLFRVLLFTAAAVGASAAVSFPLWYLATNHTKLYTGISLVALLAGGIFLVGRAVVRSVNSAGGFRRYARDFLAPGAASLGKIVLVIALFYINVLLYYQSLLIIAIPSSLVLLAITGYFLYARGKRKQTP